MSMSISITERGPGDRLTIRGLGSSLSAFLGISYILCVLGYVLFPSLPIAHSALSIFLPGFTLLNWQSFALGLVEAIAWGWYVAVVFVPLYRFFTRHI